MPVNNLQAGAADFARALLSGGAIESDAQLQRQMLYDRQDSGRAELDRKITEALLKRDTRTAQQGYAPALERTLGVDPQTGTDLATLSIGGLAKNIEQVQKYDLRNRALRALQDPELNLAPGNAELAALDGKPLQHVTTQGVNTIENRYSDMPALDLTELGQAQVRATDARAAASSAQANLANVKAAGGGFAPRAGGAGAATGGGIRVLPAGSQNSTPTVERATYSNKQVNEAKAVIRSMLGMGLDPTGYGTRQVADDLADDGEIQVAHRPANSLRFITPRGVQDLPLQAPSTAPVPAPVAQAAAIPPGAIAKLRANSGLAADFEAKYGVPAAQFLSAP